MNLTHHVREQLRTAEFLHDFPQSVAIHRVKGFRQIDEGSVKETVQTIEYDTGEDLPGDFEQRDASVIITELPVPLPLVEMDIGRVIEILRNLSLATRLMQECIEFCHQPEPTVLVDFRWECDGSRAEQRCSPLDSRASDDLDGFENVVHFIAVRIPLDFLSRSDHPGVLQLPQPLLYKAAASEKGCFCGVILKVYVRFM
ncbi:unnamed protein product [Schistocephalus solidus]|uniref:RWD domain-containing protein n=1 Tax=Schistocephalus solidus TaxID=70667 RepID=A0A183S8R1_SCHSO|nr:unnamed protein product [Schistocephalus solidus]